jgi:hypothetical protein
MTLLPVIMWLSLWCTHCRGVTVISDSDNEKKNVQIDVGDLDLRDSRLWAHTNPSARMGAMGLAPLRSAGRCEPLSRRSPRTLDDPNIDTRAISESARLHCGTVPANRRSLGEGPADSPRARAVPQPATQWNCPAVPAPRGPSRNLRGCPAAFSAAAASCAGRNSDQPQKRAAWEPPT